MDLGPVRSLALDVIFSAHGVPATVTRPDLAPIETRVLWMDDSQFGAEDTNLEILRAVPRRVMTLRRSEVSAAAVGTQILAPPVAGAVAQRWRVDQIAHVEPELMRLIVKPDPTAAELETWGKTEA